MRFIAVEVTDLTAVIEARPCWLARLFGAQVMRIELCRPKGMSGYRDEWRSVGTGSLVRALDDGSEILQALDFRPVAAIPKARVI